MVCVQHYWISRPLRKPSALIQALDDRLCSRRQGNRYRRCKAARSRVLTLSLSSQVEKDLPRAMQKKLRLRVGFHFLLGKQGFSWAKVLAGRRLIGYLKGFSGKGQPGVGGFLLGSFRRLAFGVYNGASFPHRLPCWVVCFDPLITMAGTSK